MHSVHMLIELLSWLRIQRFLCCSEVRLHFACAALIKQDHALRTDPLQAKRPYMVRC